MTDKSNKEIARLIKENEANLVIGILKSGAETPHLIHKYQQEQQMQQQNRPVTPPLTPPPQPSTSLSHELSLTNTQKGNIRF